MGIKSYNPYTPSRRFAKGSTFEEITKAKPERSLTKAKKSQAGRDNHGHISVRHRGGGVKRRLRLIDWRRARPAPAPRPSPRSATASSSGACRSGSWCTTSSSCPAAAAR